MFRLSQRPFCGLSHGGSSMFPQCYPAVWSFKGADMTDLTVEHLRLTSESVILPAEWGFGLAMCEDRPGTEEYNARPTPQASAHNGRDPPALFHITYPICNTPGRQLNLLSPLIK